MAKYVLNSTSEDLDFVLIGISCAEDQYSFVALIEDSLKIKFSLSDFVPFNLSEGRIFNFSLFKFSDKELGLEYSLVPNLSNLQEPGINNDPGDLFSGVNIDERIRLVKELPKTDYFLILKGEDLHNYQFRIIEKLKPCPEIIQIQSIEPLDLPSKKNLIF